MRRVIAVVLFGMLALGAFAAQKQKGQTTLKDVQPAGTTDKKHKHLQYDLTFNTTDGKEYTCRTPEKKKMKATEMPVGSNVGYEIDNDKGKVKLANGKQIDCTIVRVADAAPGSSPAAAAPAK